MPRLLSLCALLAAALSLRADPPRLELHPASLDLAGPGDRHRILVTFVESDGRRRDLTRAANYESEQARVCTVTASGEVHAAAFGETTVAVTAGGLTAELPVAVANGTNGEPPSFLNDVIPLLTRLGCNQGSCHGKGSGQNGFRLSLRGYAPEMDHRWLTREFASRRTAGLDADESLLLRKATGRTPHEGGAFIRPTGYEYALLRSWLETGTPGPKAGETPARKLEVLPGPRSLRVGDEQQLLVRAEFAPGVWRDVTWLTRFDSNDAGLITVTPAGRVTALRHGETAIRAAFQGEVAAVVMTVPHETPVNDAAFNPRNNAIDDHVFAKLKALRIEPSGSSDDYEFVRRAYLDAIGTLPTPDEVRAFVADPSSDKRAKLIDALLERPEWVDLWTLFLADLMQNRRERDHDVRGPKGVRAFHAWLREQVAKNRPWDELARDVLTATGSTEVAPAVGYYLVTVGEFREVEKSEVADAVAQAFLGSRIGCAKCHNHPLERYTQDDYYHFAAFFSRVKLDRAKGDPKGHSSLAVSARDPKENAKPVGVRQPRTGAMMRPQPLDRSDPAVQPGDDPRTKLAAWVTDPKNEAFAGAMVNRLWKHFFGVGLVEPVDDLRATNPPSNPGLWRELNRAFVASRYDLKHLMRLMLNSRAYQLSAATTPANANETRFYSHYYARRLPAEVLLDAVSAAVGVPESFPGYPVGLRAVQLPDPGVRSGFLGLFGRSERVTACACERTGDVTVPQLLHLQNNSALAAKLKSVDGRLARLLAAKADDAAVLEELFLALYSRPPRDERAKIATARGAADDRGEFYRDLLWAMLNAKEFAFNH